MQPVNSKSLFAMICGQIEKLDKNEIGVDQAKAQANLFKQANNVLKYELDRATTEIKVRQFNAEHKSNVEIRNVESKKFD